MAKPPRPEQENVWTRAAYDVWGSWPRRLIVSASTLVATFGLWYWAEWIDWTDKPEPRPDFALRWGRLWVPLGIVGGVALLTYLAFCVVALYEQREEARAANKPDAIDEAIAELLAMKHDFRGRRTSDAHLLVGMRGELSTGITTKALRRLICQRLRDLPGDQPYGIELHEDALHTFTTKLIERWSAAGLLTSEYRSVSGGNIAMASTLYKLKPEGLEAVRRLRRRSRTKAALRAASARASATPPAASSS